MEIAAIRQLASADPKVLDSMKTLALLTTAEGLLARPVLHTELSRAQVLSTQFVHVRISAPLSKLAFLRGWVFF